MSRTETRVIKTLHTKVWHSPVCDRCGAPLQYPFQEQESNHPWQCAVDASILAITGGYAGFVDDESLQIDLCKSCTEAVLDFLGISMDSPLWIDPHGWLR